MSAFSTTQYLRARPCATTMLALLFTIATAGAQEASQHLPKGSLLATPAIPLSQTREDDSREIISRETFSAGAPGWRITGGWTVPQQVLAQPNSKPVSSLAISNSSAPYSNQADDWAISPRLTLLAPQFGTRFTLHLHERFELESGYDFGYVKVSLDDGLTWITLSARDGKNDGREHEIDLTPFARREIRLAFHLVSDASNAYAGWHISSAAIAQTTSSAFSAIIRNLNSQNFPFTYMNVEVIGEGLPILAQHNFVARENGVLQTDFFSVTPPDAGGGVRLADIIFLIDDTGSMAEEIAAVRNNVNNFLTALQTRSINYALGLVTFKDDVSLYNSGILTQNISQYQSWINALGASAGGDIPENSFGALNVALSSFSFRPGAQKIFILITDAPSHVPPAPSYVTPPPPSLSQINTFMANAGVNCYAVAIEDPQYVGVGSITNATGGEFFNVTSPFNTILDDITEIVARTYIVSYRSSNPSCDGVTRNVAVTVTHAGSSTTANGSYIPCVAPRIVRTPATIGLSSSAQIAGSSLTIAAEITDPVAPFTQSATLFYRRTGDPAYFSTAMARGSGNIYQAAILGGAVQPPGIDYYLTATDGQVTSSDPAVNAAASPYQIAVLPNQPPQIIHTAITSGATGNAIAISCIVQDNTNFITTVELYFRVFGTLLFTQQSMTNAGGNNYTGTIPASAVTLADVEYYIRAVDNFGVATTHGVHLVNIGDGGECQPATLADNFSDNNFDGWLPRVISNWGVDPVNGNPAFCIRSGNPGGDEYSVLAAGRWRDFTLELRVRSSATSNKNFFVIFGVQDFPNSTEDSYYLRFTPSTVDLFRSVGGNAVVIATTAGSYPSDNNYHTIRIERQGQNIRVLADSRLLFSPTDGTFMSGLIGFGSYQSTACFDDVSVSGCLEGSGEVGPLVYSSHLIDDNSSGASTGDGDGRAEGGERVELVVSVRNQGELTASGVSALLSTSDSDVTIFDNSNLWPDIPGGLAAESSSNFGFSVNSGLSQTRTALFTMTISAANGGPWTSTFSIQIGPGDATPPPDLSASRVYLRTGPNSGAEVANPVAGQQYYIHFDWSNLGGAASGFRYAIYFNGAEICGVSSVTAPAGASRTVWCDAPIQWPSGGGVIEGALDVHSHLAEPTENNNTASRVFGFQSFGDFDFTAQTRSTENLSNNGGADICFVYGYQDERHYYYVMFNRGLNETRVYKVRERERILVGDLGAFVISDNSYHTVLLRRSGGNLQVYWDGALLGTATDAEYGSGGMGLGSFNDSAIWDEICLKPGTGGTCTVFDNFEDGTPEGWLPLHPSRWGVVTDGGDRGYRIEDAHYENLDYLRLGEYSLIAVPTSQRRADLVASDLSLRTGINSGSEIDHPVAGQQYYAHFNWRNTGDGSAGNFLVEIRLNGTVLCGQVITTAGPEPGPPFTTVCITPLTWPAGSNIIQGVVDVNNNVLEYSEVNNTRTRTYPDNPPCLPSACAGPVIFPVRAGGANAGEPISGRDASTICVDIRVQQNTQPIGAFGFQVKVNPAHLAFTSFTAGDLTQNFVTKEARQTPPGSGVIICGGFGTTAIPANSSGVLLRLCFTVACDADASSEIQITGLTDDVAGLTGCCNEFICTSCAHDGDVNSDLTLTPGDAFCAFNIFLNAGTVPASCDAPEFDCELTAADVNCDGAVTPGDAFEIFNRYLRGGAPQDCFARTGPAKAIARTEPYRLTWQPRVVLPPPNSNLPEVVKVAVRADNPQGLQAFGMRFAYPADRLEFVGIERAALTGDWVKLEGAALASGEILVGGFHTQAILSTAGGELFHVLYVAKGEAVSAADFSASDFVDDLRHAEVQAGVHGTSTATAAPRAFSLYQNYPNPLAAKTAAAHTMIRFDLPGTQFVKVELAIYNIAGQIVRHLLSDARLPGTYEIIWDGKDEQGQWAPSGTYWYRLRAGNFNASKQLTVLR